MLTTNVMPQSLGYYLPRPSLVPITNMQPAAPRAASEKWNAQDDAQLMQARAQGLNWAPLQSRYFPTKTPNACRKRHERLMEKRNSEDWSPERVENLGKEYLNVRKEMWSILASRTGERWQDVEKKCLEKGLKNLQAAGRAASKRERTFGNNSGFATGDNDFDAEGEDDIRDPHDEVREDGRQKRARTTLDLSSTGDILHTTPQP